MMDKIFFRVLNMSLVSGYVIALILLLRPLFGRISKRFSYALWGVALFRLLCPFSIGSLASLVPVSASRNSTVQRKSPSDSRVYRRGSLEQRNGAFGRIRRCIPFRFNV